MAQRTAQAEALVRVAPYLQPCDMTTFGLTPEDFPHHLGAMGSSLLRAEMAQMARRKRQVRFAEDLEHVFEIAGRSAKKQRQEKLGGTSQGERVIDTRVVRPAGGVKKLTKPASPSKKKQLIPNITVSPAVTTTATTTTTVEPSKKAVAPDALYVPPPVFTEPLTPITAAILKSWPKPKPVKPTASESRLQRAEMTIKERMAMYSPMPVTAEATFDATMDSDATIRPPSTPRKAPTAVAPLSTTPPRDVSTPRLRIENKFRQVLLAARVQPRKAQPQGVQPPKAQPRKADVRPTRESKVLDKAQRIELLRHRIEITVRLQLPPKPTRQIRERRARLLEERRKAPYFAPLSRSQVLEEQEIGGKVDRMLQEIRDFFQETTPETPVDANETVGDLRVEDLLPPAQRRAKVRFASL